MTTNDSADQRGQDALRRHALWRAAWEAETAISAVISDPEVQRLRTLIEEEEVRLGDELRARFQTFQDRYDQAVRDLDADALTRICPGKHGRWGRICVLDDGHDPLAGAPHWGYAGDGRPIAWLGTAPDDD
ncbi:hypothetical protein OOK44_35430 [Streptomyces cellulosae]|uniref:Uncharacterized protein n=1 Tax=Streptomyces althioticus TaxID=83380 RepID=A0ABZ1YK38_9ACTN|nr:hypothetical protein [Streptomyces cellulosae]WTB93295.1 hypothetical protein OIE99_34180 [Streptomyces cellulosae]WTC60687.1 hypothetical protein OH715_35935 [Streptomyces cellulosae]